MRHAHAHARVQVLGVINLRDERFEFYDPLGGGDISVLNNLRRWLKDFWNYMEVGQNDKEYKKLDDRGSLDLSDWGNYMAPRLPSQTNDVDCGVFVLK